MTNQGRSIIRYSISFQQKVVRELEESGVGMELIRKKYGIGGVSTIQAWVRKFGKNHLLNRVIRVETMNEKDRVRELEEEIKRLKLALADSMLAQRSLEVLIDQANKMYQTDLKKSFGEKSSSSSGNNGV